MPEKFCNEQSFQTLASSESHGSSLAHLVKGLDGVIKSQRTQDVQVLSLAMDSRKVIPGSLFFAIGGDSWDGNQFIDEAIDRGAIGIVSDQPLKGFSQIAILQVQNVRTSMATIAKRFYDSPDEKLTLVGVTGTNGKTTVTSILRDLSKANDLKPGLIGTVSCDLGGRTLPSMKTTPESIDAYGFLSQMVKSQCQTAFIEVSSHGLALHRVHQMNFDVAVFMNLTQDHLDFHGDMEAYYLDKKKFFTGEIGTLPKVAVINVDDPYGKRLASELSESIRIVTIGINSDATLRAQNITLTDKGSSFDLVSPQGTLKVTTTLLGNYNVSNLLAALAVVFASNLDLEAYIKSAATLKAPPGRMEKVDAGQPFTLLVDYAHTDDALHNGLTMLRELTPGKLIAVFGCGGNRDRTKRPKMMQVVNSLADTVWATSDNPRTESISQIFDDMREGMTCSEKVNFVEERRLAIAKAIDSAQPGDCILIAGKGHETYQEIGNTVVPFDDRKVAAELLSFKNFTQ